MEKAHRERIQVNYLNLSKAIRIDILTVVKYLFQEGIISDTMEEDIMCQRTPTEKAYKLLDMIQTRGPKAYAVLYQALIVAELWEAADLLEPINAPHGLDGPTLSSTSVISTESSEEDEPLPDDWPTESHMNNVELYKLKVKQVEENQAVMMKRFHNPNKAEVYEMNYKFKGRVLIIDNEEFKDKKLDDRTGSSQDVRGLRCVFQAMDFDVWVEKNKTKKEMEAILDEECRRNFKDFGCFILIMLSHGVRGKVFGTDGIAPKEGTPVTEVKNYIEIEEVKRRIASLDTLKGKPKMFIIQACQNDESTATNTEQSQQESSASDIPSAGQQGNSSNHPIFPGVKRKTHPEPFTAPAGDSSMNVDLGDNSRTTDNVDSSQTFVKRLAGGSDSSDETDGNMNNGGVEADAGDASPNLRPPEGSDVFIALATIEGHPSYRNTAFGSWFIQAFIYVLANYAHKHELSSLMRKVTQLVMKARSKKDESQVCERRSTMDKEFYFFPGLTVSHPGIFI